MERNIAVYNRDGELLQWIDQKRFLRLVDVGRVARVVKTRTGRVRRITLVQMPGEWKPSLFSDYKGTKYSFRQHLDDGRRFYRLRALGSRIARLVVLACAEGVDCAMSPKSPHV